MSSVPVMDLTIYFPIMFPSRIEIDFKDYMMLSKETDTWLGSVVSGLELRLSAESPISRN